jgi:hypothetical protein
MKKIVEIFKPKSFECGCGGTLRSHRKVAENRCELVIPGLS